RGIAVTEPRLKLIRVIESLISHPWRRCPRVILLIIEALAVNNSVAGAENAEINEERVVSNRRRLFTRLEHIDGHRNARSQSVAAASFRMGHARPPAAVRRRRQTGEPLDLRLNHLFLDYHWWNEFLTVLFAQCHAVRIRRARAIYEFEALFCHNAHSSENIHVL